MPACHSWQRSWRTASAAAALVAWLPGGASPRLTSALPASPMRQVWRTPSWRRCTACCCLPGGQMPAWGPWSRWPAIAGPACRPAWQQRARPCCRHCQPSQPAVPASPWQCRWRQLLLSCSSNCGSSWRHAAALQWQRRQRQPGRLRSPDHLLCSCSGHSWLREKQRVHQRPRLGSRQACRLLGRQPCRRVLKRRRPQLSRQQLLLR